MSEISSFGRRGGVQLRQQHKPVVPPNPDCPVCQYIAAGKKSPERLADELSNALRLAPKPKGFMGRAV